MKFPFFFIIVLLNCHTIFGQPGSLDPSLGNTGIVSVKISKIGLENCDAMVIQKDGKIICTGNAQYKKPGYYFSTVRYNTNGGLDSTFGVNGISSTSFGYGYAQAHSVVIQDDGKIVVSGVYMEDIKIVRYNYNGCIDTSFGVAGTITASHSGYFLRALSSAIQTDGKIIVVGDARGISGRDIIIYRFNIDGSIDSTFGFAGNTIIELGNTWLEKNAVIVQKDGKFLVVGTMAENFFIMRFNELGISDSTFGFGCKVITDFNGGVDKATAISIQNDGRIIVAGTSSGRFAMARYFPDGAVDCSFGVNGQVLTRIGDLANLCNSICIQHDGKIILAGGGADGNLMNYDFALLRYSQEGAIDSLFGINGCVTTDIRRGYNEVCTIALQADHKIIAAGKISNGAVEKDNLFGMVRYNSE